MDEQRGQRERVAAEVTAQAKQGRDTESGVVIPRGPGSAWG